MTARCVYIAIVLCTCFACALVWIIRPYLSRRIRRAFSMDTETVHPAVYDLILRRLHFAKTITTTFLAGVCMMGMLLSGGNVSAQSEIKTTDLRREVDRIQFSEEALAMRVQELTAWKESQEKVNTAFSNQIAAGYGAVGALATILVLLQFFSKWFERKKDQG